jgi:hypothetical protein
MNETLTLNDLILYLYNETELSQTVQIQQAIDNHEEVAETFESLVEARSLVQQSLMHASPISVQSVLAYATLTAPLQAR